MEHLPPWLRNVPLPPRPSGRGQPTAPSPGALAAPDAPPAAPPESGGTDEMPSWLIELQGEVGETSASGEAQGDTPDWLTNLDAPSPHEPPPPIDPSWLSDPSGQMPSDPPADQQSTTSRVKMPVGATEWLRSIGHDPDARSEPLSEPISHIEESGVPEWLREMSADEVARGIEADVPNVPSGAESDVPSWLSGDQPGPDASTVSSNFRGLSPDADETADQSPSWLDELASSPSAETARPAPPTGDLAGNAEVPAWLRDLGEETPAPGESEPPLDDEPAWLREAANRPPTDRLAAADDVEVPAWLREADEPAPPSFAPHASEMPPAVERAAPQPADDMPAWLREAGAPETPASPAHEAAPDWLSSTPATDEGDVPSWLQEADASPEAGDVPSWLQDSSPSAPPPAVGDVPSWLQDSSPSAPPPAAGEVPSWLQDSSPSASPAADVPDWLHEAEAPPPAGGMPSWLQDSSPSAAPAGDVPDWLHEAEAPLPAAGEVPSWLQDSSPSAAPAGDVPDWLHEAEAMPPPAGVRPAQPSSGGPPAPSGDLPPWLSAEDLPPSGPAGGTPADPGLPSWLRGVADEPPPPAQSPRPAPPRRPVPGSEPSESQSFLSGAELPSWLRVPEPERPSDPSEGQALDWLRRLGGAEQEEELQAAAAAVAVVPQRPLYQRSAEQLTAIGLLQRISRSPYPEPPPPAVAAPLTSWQRIGLDRVLYALLALALLLALVVPSLTTPLQTATPTAPGAADLGALLDSLGSDDVALVAYEWGAQRSGELRPLESAVVSRLVARKVKLILVSTDLQGTLLAFDLVGPLRAAGYNNENGVSFGGRDYVLLGYRPGGELALRSIAQDLRGELRSDFDGQDATQSLVANTAEGSPRFSGINDLSLILVLADQPQDVQAWMEQIHPAAGDVPMAFLLPQEAQPLAQPFLRLPNVYHLAGLPGALALQAGDPSGDPGAVARASGQLWFAVSVFLLLLLGGAVAALVRRRDRGGAA